MRPVSEIESQRDSGSKPKVARHELPWETFPELAATPTGLCRRRDVQDAPPLGLGTLFHQTQGSSCLPPSRRAIAPLRRDGGATLGWRTQSLWDWPRRASADAAAGAPHTAAVLERRYATRLVPNLQPWAEARGYHQCLAEFRKEPRCALSNFNSFLEGVFHELDLAAFGFAKGEARR